MSDESAESATTDGDGPEVDPIVSIEPGTAKRAYGLLARGMDADAIAEQIGVSADAVARLAGDWAVRNTQDGDPKRASAGEALRVVLRKLHTNMDDASVSDKPRYATAITQITSKLVQLDGRCGARLVEADGRTTGYCPEYPAKGRTRCPLHGGATLVGPLSGQYKDGRYSRYPFTDEASLVLAADLRNGDPFDLMLDDAAMVRVMLRRAIAEGRSGAQELRAVNDTLTKYAEITRGKKIVHVPDERAARALLNAIYVCVRRVVESRLTPEEAKALLADLAHEVVAIDWSSVNIEPVETIQIVGAPSAPMLSP